MCWRSSASGAPPTFFLRNPFFLFFLCRIHPTLPQAIFFLQIPSMVNYFFNTDTDTRKEQRGGFVEGRFWQTCPVPVLEARQCQKNIAFFCQGSSIAGKDFWRKLWYRGTSAGTTLLETALSLRLLNTLKNEAALSLRLLNTLSLTKLGV